MILLTSFFVVGGWISLIVAILPGSGSIQPDPAIWPTNFILFCAKLHFLKFKVSPDSSTVCKNFSRCSKWSFQLRIFCQYCASYNNLHTVSFLCHYSNLHKLSQIRDSPSVIGGTLLAIYLS